MYNNFVIAFDSHCLVGKILADEQPLSEYNIDEKKFIVVMVSKPKSTGGASTSDETVTEADSKSKEKTSTATTTTTAAR